MTRLQVTLCVRNVYEATIVYGMRNLIDQSVIVYIYTQYIYLRDFSIFDTMLLHLKLQTCFVLPGLICAIRSFQK